MTGLPLSGARSPAPGSLDLQKLRSRIAGPAAQGEAASKQLSPGSSWSNSVGWERASGAPTGGQLGLLGPPLSAPTQTKVSALEWRGRVDERAPGLLTGPLPVQAEELEVDVESLVF